KASVTRARAASALEGSWTRSAGSATVMVSLNGVENGTKPRGRVRLLGRRSHLPGRTPSTMRPHRLHRCLHRTIVAAAAVAIVGSVALPVRARTESYRAATPSIEDAGGRVVI